METLHSNTVTASSSGQSTQRYVDVDEIRDGVLILKNGSMRAILKVSSVNFDLKSTEEQDVIIAQYQNFLNSLDFPTQIMISSRKLNLEPYLEYLKKQQMHLTNDLLIMQLEEYRNFIKNLAEISSIMTKSFYVVVPFYPTENKDAGFFEKIFGSTNQKINLAHRREMFDTYKNQLWQRLDHIAVGLSGTGVKVVPLKTEELIELTYNAYNPSVQGNAIVKDIDKIELK